MQRIIDKSSVNFDAYLELIRVEVKEFIIFIMRSIINDSYSIIFEYDR